MQDVTPVIMNAWPYQNDKMALPVENLNDSIPFYLTVLGFKLMSIENNPVKHAVLEKDGLSIGLSENGGDPTQNGCFFEVNDVSATSGELMARGLIRDSKDFKIQKYGEAEWKVFFVIAPDQLCYCFGEKL